MAQYETFRSVLVTGGCGFVGHNVVRNLQKAQPDCRITVLDYNTTRNTFPGVDYHKVDLADGDAMHAVFSKLANPPRVIFHLACAPPLMHDDPVHWRTNVEGTRTLLSCAKELGTVQAIVYVSSSSVIHDNWSDIIEADESWPLLKPPAQKRMYTLTKAYAEEEIVAANRQAGILTAVVRPCTVFGPGDGVFSTKIHDLVVTNKARFQMGDGRNEYDFTFVDNIVHALFLAATALLRARDAPELPAGDPNRVDGEAFHIANGDRPRLPFWGFTLAFAEAWGKPVKEEELVKIPRWAGKIMGFVAEWLTWIFSLGKRQSRTTVETVNYTYIVRTFNIDKAKRVLGYQPLVPMDEAIKRTVAWFKERDETEAKKQK